MLQPGQKLTLTVHRGGKDTNLEAQVAEMPENQQAQAQANPNANEQKEEPKVGSLGLELSSIDPTIRRHFQIPRDVEGVVVTRIASDSPFAELGLESGDVIQSIDQQPVMMLRSESIREMTPLQQESGKTVIVGHTSRKSGEILDLVHMK